MISPPRKFQENFLLTLLGLFLKVQKKTKNRLFALRKFRSAVFVFLLIYFYIFFDLLANGSMNLKRD